MAETGIIKETFYTNANNGNWDVNRIVDTSAAQQPLGYRPSGRTCCQTHARQIEKAGKCAKWIAWGIVIAIIIIMGISGGLVFGGVVSFELWTMGTLVLDNTTKIGLAILSMEGGSGIVLLLLDYGVYRYRIHSAFCPNDPTIRQNTILAVSDTITSTVDIPNETLNAIDEQSASHYKPHRLSEQTSSSDSEDGREEHNNRLELKIAKLKRQSDEYQKASDDLDKEVHQVKTEVNKVKDEVVTLQKINDQNAKTISKLQQESKQLKKESEQLKANDRKQTKTLDDLETTLIIGKQKLQDLEKRMQRLEQTTHTTQPQQTSQTLIVVTMQPPNHKFIV